VQPAAQSNVLRVDVSPSLLPVLTPLLARVRRLFDLDANPSVIDAHLCARSPPRQADSRDAGVARFQARWTVRTRAARRAGPADHGKSGDDDLRPFRAVLRRAGADTRSTVSIESRPDAETIADASPQQIIERGLTRKRAETVRTLARAVADGLAETRTVGKRG
jgi:AraC family transcriptional regulator of adaptative response / DNA-3-methyladenine glycosylase II